MTRLGRVVVARPGRGRSSSSASASWSTATAAAPLDSARLHRRGRRPRRRPDPGAGGERRPHHRHLDPARPARAGREHRAGHGVPGVQDPQHRARRPRLGGPVPAAAVPGLGHGPSRSSTRSTRSTRSTTRWSRSRATRRWRSPRPPRPCSARPIPDAYADHEADARALASALTGNHRAAFWCDTAGDAEEAGDRLDDAGLVRRAATVRDELESVFGPLSLGGFAAGRRLRGPHGGLGALRGPGDRRLRAADQRGQPASAAGRSRTTSSRRPTGSRSTRSSSTTASGTPARAATTGWTDYDVPSSSRGDRAILEHRDHVHVDVAD